jgi:hypothetical protein
MDRLNAWSTGCTTALDRVQVHRPCRLAALPGRSGVGHVAVDQWPPWTTGPFARSRLLQGGHWSTDFGPARVVVQS